MDRKSQEPTVEPMYRPDTAGQNFACQLYGWLQPVLAALAVLVLSLFVGRFIGVQGDSMLPTLQNGNLVLLQSAGYTPQNGDVVVVATHAFESDTPIIKRIIAKGGQSVAIDYATSTVYVDGEPIPEPYLGEDMVPVPDQFAGEYPITVPEGHLFIMGDNRNHSSDSRRSTIGLVDERAVLGKALWVVFPFGSVDK